MCSTRVEDDESYRKSSATLCKSTNEEQEKPHGHACGWKVKTTCDS